MIIQSSFKKDINYKIIKKSSTIVKENDNKSKLNPLKYNYFRVRRVGIGNQIRKEEVKKQIVTTKKEVIVENKSYVLNSFNKHKIKVSGTIPKIRTVIKAGIDNHNNQMSSLNKNQKIEIYRPSQSSKVDSHKLNNNFKAGVCNLIQPQKIENKKTDSVSLKDNTIKTDNEIQSPNINYKKNISKRKGYKLAKVNNKQKSIVIAKKLRTIDKTKEIEEKIKKEVMYQQEVVNDLYEKASFFKKTYYKTYKYFGYTKVLSSMLRIIGGIITLPLTFLNMFGISVGATMINKGLKNLRKSLEAKEIISVKYDYEDISNKIRQVKDKIDYTSLVLSDSLNEIKLIKSKLKEEYKNEKGIDNIMKKIDELEDKLIHQQSKINQINKVVAKEKELNRQKMLKVGR